MNQKDSLSAAVKALPLRSPSRGFDQRLLARLRAERMWRRAWGLGLAWSCAGSAAMLAVPGWLGLRLPSLAQAKVWGAEALVEALRSGFWLARAASSACAPCLAVQLPLAGALAAAVAAALAPRPARRFMQGGIVR